MLRTFFGNASQSVQLQAEIREGIANQADLLNQRLKELIELQISQSARNEQLLKEIAAGVANKLTRLIRQRAAERLASVV